jgi:hypothetical protein
VLVVVLITVPSLYSSLYAQPYSLYSSPLNSSQYSSLSNSFSIHPLFAISHLHHTLQGKSILAASTKHKAATETARAKDKAVKEKSSPEVTIPVVAAPQAATLPVVVSTAAEAGKEHEEEVKESLATLTTVKTIDEVLCAHIPHNPFTTATQILSKPLSSALSLTSSPLEEAETCFREQGLTTRIGQTS